MLDRASTLGSISTSATLKTPGNPATPKTQTGYRVSTSERDTSQPVAPLNSALQHMLSIADHARRWAGARLAFKGLLKSEMV